MTDKKALEVLKSWLRLAYQNADGTDECCAELYEALQTMFALINRQQEEIENLTYTLLGVMHNVDKWLDGVELEQDEVNRAATMREKTLRIVEEKQAEIERLKIENQAFRSAANSYKLHYNEARTEAHKGFAERLKNKIKTECNPYGKPTFDYDTSLAIMRYIDNLVKEMVGENNGKI